MRRIELPRLGWRRDLPDPRDFTPSHEPFRDLLSALKRRGGRREERTSSVDLREYIAPPAETFDAADSAAAAVTALVEFFERRASGRRLDLAFGFLTHVAQRLMRGEDSPADLRTTLRALVRFGVPPQEFWPLDADESFVSSDPFLYGFSRDFASISFVRLDPPEASGGQILRNVRAFLAAGFACAFGAALSDALADGPDIPFPTRLDTVRGGAALMAIGYDDKRRIRSSKGALLVRGVWGGDWGESGFGWLPYRYLEDRLAGDFWTLLKPEWLASGEFTRPAV